MKDLFSYLLGKKFCSQKGERARGGGRETEKEGRKGGREIGGREGEREKGKRKEENE